MAKFCSSCGTQLSDTTQFCGNCGAPVAANGPVVNNVNVNTTTVNGAVQPKSKMAAGLLGIFLGSFGVHNFYLGYTGKAVAQLLISVLSCGFLAVVSSIWGLIEGILILCGNITVDGKGNPLAD